MSRHIRLKDFLKIDQPATEKKVKTCRFIKRLVSKYRQAKRDLIKAESVAGRHIELHSEYFHKWLNSESLKKTYKKALDQSEVDILRLVAKIKALENK